MAFGFQSTLAAYCGEGRIFLCAQEFINSALAVTSVCVSVCLFGKSMWLCRVAVWAWISTSWLSEGLCHISARTCRRWVVPWLQVVRCIYSVQQRPPVLTAHRCLEAQVSEELMALRWRGCLRKSGNNSTLGVLWYRVGSVQEGTRVCMGWMGAFHFIHRLAVLGQRISTYTSPCL